MGFVQSLTIYFLTKWDKPFSILFFYSFLHWSYWCAVIPFVVWIQHKYTWLQSHWKKPLLVNAVICFLFATGFVFWGNIAFFIVLRPQVSLYPFIVDFKPVWFVVFFIIGILVYSTIVGIINGLFYFRMWQSSIKVARDLKAELIQLIDEKDQQEKVNIDSVKYASRLLVKSKKRAFLIDTDRIEWIEAAGYYIIIHYEGREYLLRKSLRYLEQKLNPDSFFRVHRSSIVNLSFINEMKKEASGDYTIVLNSGKTLKLVRSRMNLLESLLNKMG